VWALGGDPRRSLIRDIAPAPDRRLWDCHRPEFTGRPLPVTAVRASGSAAEDLSDDSPTQPDNQLTGNDDAPSVPGWICNLCRFPKPRTFRNWVSPVAAV
jgi:hypothetical protein